LTIEEERISEHELHAFIDGELDEARCRQVAAEIAAVPALAERAAQFRKDKERLAKIYGPLIDRPLPERLVPQGPAPRGSVLQELLRRVVEQAMQRFADGRARAAVAITAAAALVIAAWLGYGLFFTGSARDALVATALAARDGKLAPESQIAAAAISAPDARDRIVASNLAVSVKAPDLRKAGYDLTTLSIYPDGTGRHSLQLTYHNQQGRMFTVYLTHPTGPQGFELTERGAMRICVWLNEELSAVMVGEMSSGEMLRVASLTYADLNF
jgi:anti-sigma factor RsiW